MRRRGVTSGLPAGPFRRSQQRCCRRWLWQGLRGLAEAERGHTGTGGGSEQQCHQSTGGTAPAPPAPGGCGLLPRSPVAERSQPPAPCPVWFCAPPMLSPCSLPFPASVTALRLRARKDRVGVISRSTMLLSQGLSCKLRSEKGQEPSVLPRAPRHHPGPLSFSPTAAKPKPQLQRGCPGTDNHGTARAHALVGDQAPVGRRCGRTATLSPCPITRCTRSEHLEQRWGQLCSSLPFPPVPDAGTHPPHAPCPGETDTKPSVQGCCWALHRALAPKETR